MNILLKDKMMFAEYYGLYSELYDKFREQYPIPVARGRPHKPTEKCLIFFFMKMMVKRINCFENQATWLNIHPLEAKELGFGEIPNRTTLMRRYPKLAQSLFDFIHFIAQINDEPELSNEILYFDASIFKAQGPVAHKSTRNNADVRKKLRNVDYECAFR